jgi:hypothetical protein
MPLRAHYSIAGYSLRLGTVTLAQLLPLGSTMYNTAKLAATVVLTLASATSSAALVSRGAGMVYDSDQNVTWLSNPNLAAASIYDDGDSPVDGRMTLASALAWVDALDFGGYSDWRLPTAPMRDATCSLDNTAVNYGYGCLGNELGHLFYVEFGAAAGQAVSSSGSAYLSLFSAIDDAPGASGYWIDSPWCCSNHPGFRFAGGELIYTVPQNQLYAWALRDGDVLATVPEPGTAALSVLALGVLLSSTWSRQSRPRTARRA